MGVALKFTGNRTNSERTLYLKTAHVSVCIFFVSMCRVSITGKQRSGRVRLVILSIAVLDKKLSSIREMSAKCHTRGVPGVPLHHI